MSVAIRSLAAFMGLAWVVVLPLWMVGESIPSTLRAERVRAADWQRATQAELGLPHRWQAGRGRPPLLPVEGKIARRGAEVLLTGAALVPGTFGADQIAITVERPTNVYSVGPTRAPLLPFMAGGPEVTEVARTVELCCGIEHPASLQREGLHVQRREREVVVFGADGETPLFPPTALHTQHDERKRETTAFGLSVVGNHVRVTVDERLVLDFHTTVALKGAVGIVAREGVLPLQRIEVTRPTH